jgi:hypothetical protein
MANCRKKPRQIARVIERQECLNGYVEQNAISKFDRTFFLGGGEVECRKIVVKRFSLNKNSWSWQFFFLGSVLAT